jgi:hypothetical protein
MRQKLAWRTGYRTPRVVRSGCIFPELEVASSYSRILCY